MRAELAGFRPILRRGIRLSVSEHVAVDLTLEVGGVAEAVTVNAETPTVNTRAGDLSYLVESTAIRAAAAERAQLHRSGLVAAGRAAVSVP